MDASSILLALSLILLVGSPSAAPTDDDNAIENPGLKDLEKCVTGKGIPGNCVIRNDCEFNTPAIDLTLYKPKGFKSACSNKEVCCPEKYQVQTTTPPEDQEKEDDFSFDDDD